MLLQSKKIENSGKLQIINRKFQNRWEFQYNAISDVKNDYDYYYESSYYLLYSKMGTAILVMGLRKCFLHAYTSLGKLQVTSIIFMCE